MPQSLVKNLIHLVFSTKQRAPLISETVRDPMHRYMAGIFENCECRVPLTNSVADHVHTLFSLSKNWSLKDVVEELKRSSSKWMKTQGKSFADFYWQSGYGAFSVSESAVARVKRYIANQEEHHRRVTFQDEFRELCRRHGVAINERYVWD
jgi:REP element-mobilizing transposase RayT